MGLGDWNILTGGDALAHDSFQHANVPDQQLSHDSWCRRIQHTAGSGYGRMLWMYDRVSYSLSQDLSARVAFSTPSQDSGAISAGVGVRCNTNILTTAGNAPTRFAEDGYWFVRYDTIGEYTLELTRVVDGDTEVLLSATRPSTAGVYQWWQLRMDILMQANGDATIHLWENDPLKVPINSAAWTRVGGDINETAFFVPAFSGVCWGVQTSPGNDVYVDWAEVWHS